MDLLTVAAVVIWGAVVGVDLISFPQAMLNRPIVAATVAGLIVGDLEAGLRVGVVLELFALDVLPIGAARYPDFGPGAVAAGALAARGADLLGTAALLGLGLAVLGGRSVDWLRRINGRRVRLAEGRLAAGDPQAVRQLHLQSLATDVARSAILTGVGLALVAPAAFLAEALPGLERSLTLTAVAGGLAASLHGLTQRSRAGWPQVWLTAGLAAGAAIAWLF